MGEEFLGDRKKALEESFFAKENARLLDRMKAETKDKETAEALANIAGISDAAVLDKLVDLGIEANTWAAISLVPLVEVAWADGKVEAKERKAVLSAAEASGVAPGSPSHDLLDSWLTHRPDARLMSVWGEYVVDMCANLSPGEKEAVKETIVGRARSVAESVGGFLGMGSKISVEEGVVLDELAKAFD